MVYIDCPFCGNQTADAKTGKTVCPSCSASFEIDDCGECVFVDLDNLRLPVEGTVCTGCGLVQREARSCYNCGAGMNNRVQ